jgi:hypothetical protein
MKKIFGIICVFLLLGFAGCKSVSPGSTGGPPLNEKVSLVANKETPVKDSKLVLTLKETAPGPPATASIDAKLLTMEILRVLKAGDSFELGEYKVTVLSVGPPDKPSCEVQVLRQ